jgi:hypothetical protein
VVRGWWSRAAPFLEQPSPRKFEILLNDLKPKWWFRLLYFAPCRLLGQCAPSPKHATTRLPPEEAPEAHVEFFFAAGANGTNMHQWLSALRKATANDSSSSKVHRRESLLATVPIKPDI